MNTIQNMAAMLVLTGLAEDRAKAASAERREFKMCDDEPRERLEAKTASIYGFTKGPTPNRYTPHIGKKQLAKAAKRTAQPRSPIRG